MSEGLNKVMLLGNLGADPELRTTGAGQAVLKLRLATSENYLDRNKQRQERTEWHSVIIWNKRAEALAKILSKGDRLFVEGSIRTSSYDDRDGNKRYRTEIVASNVLLQGRSGGGGQRDSGHASEPAPVAETSNPTGAGAVPDDDVPFAPTGKDGGQ